MFLQADHVGHIGDLIRESLLFHGALESDNKEYADIIKEWGDKYVKTRIIKSYVVMELMKGRSIKEWKEYLQLEPEKADPSDSVTSIGRSKKDGKWYGWSHRAIHGFPTKQQAKKFAESVS